VTEDRNFLKKVEGGGVMVWFAVSRGCEKILESVENESGS